MKNKFKNIVANALVVFVFCTLLSIGGSNGLIKEVYASTSTDYELSELELQKSGGSIIQLYDSSSCKNDDKVDSGDIEDGETYYTKKLSYRNVKIDVSGVDDDNVRLFLGTSSSTKGVKVGKTVSLSSGTNTLKIRVYSKDPGSSVRYRDKDDVEKEYTIKAKYSGSDDDDDDDDYDDIYLKSLSLSDGEIDFHKKTTNYDVYVNSSVKELTIKAKPEDEDEETVTIDGTEVDDSDNYKHEVSLINGKNKIEIEIENDDDDSRKYILYVYRGNYSESINNSSSVVNGFNPITSSKVINTGSSLYTSAVATPTNQWSIVNGHWAYIDSLGRQLANTWFYDSNLGNYYYFKADGSMATGWQHINGKWYYLYSSGAMAKNTWINGYYVDSTGAWVA